MTTPTTPAADAHKFGAYADKIGHWSDGPETFVICKAKHVQLGAQTYGPPQAVESRESALIADYQRLMDKRNALHVNAQAVRVERDAALAAVERVRAIHQKRGASWPHNGGTYVCDADNKLWPCPTVAALDGAPEPVSVRCGGCRDLGPHNYGPGCEYRQKGESE